MKIIIELMLKNELICAVKIALQLDEMIEHRAAIRRNIF